MNSATVLVVEDEQIIANDIRQSLLHLGYSVPDTVDTGALAIRTAEQLKPQLVLMDIKLKGQMDGVAAASEISGRFGIPIVYLTSHSDDATVARAAETRPYGYLVKPFNDRDLRTTIEVALQKHEFEARLQAREHWFATTLQSIGDAVIATDAGGIIFMNAVAEKLTGWARDEGLGKKVEEVFCLLDASGQPFENPLRVALRESFTVRLPARIAMLPRTGGRVAVDDSAAPIVDEKGNVVGGVVVFRDVTDRIKLEQRLAQSERLASLGTMAAGIGHEINNPLSYVISNVDLSVDWAKEIRENLRALKVAATDRPVLDRALVRLGELGDALRDASDGADRVRRIVRDLKRFTRVEGSDSQLIDVSNVLETAIKMTAHAMRHHARLRKEYGTMPLVEANEGQLTQVFTNLLVNALEAIGEGHADDHEIRVSTRTDRAGRALVEVHDTGPGIPADVLPRIFDPFFTTKPTGAGMGLGLAICHNIIASFDGELTVESAPGRGTTFCVALPPAPGSSGTQKTAARAASPPVRRARVLVVDDEKAVATAIARMLRPEHDVTIETDPTAALRRIASEEAYDVIFCDLMMPNTSGIDVYEALASSAPGQAKRVVFMTGGAFSERSRSFLESVSNISISKPFTIESIRSIVSDYVGEADIGK